MADRKRAAVATSSNSGRRAWARFPPFDEGDVRVADCLARDHLHRALPPDVADRDAAHRRRSSKTRRQRIEGDLAEAQRAQGRIRRGARGLREGAGRRARPRAGARQRDPRQAQRRGRSARARRSRRSSTRSSPRPRRPSPRPDGRHGQRARHRQSTPQPPSSSG